MLRYKEIKRMLMDMVVKMYPGEKLPSRHELCKRLDTSRVTLDKAIAEMEKEGISTPRRAAAPTSTPSWGDGAR